VPSIVSDTTPLHYLILIDAVDVLPKLYSSVLIPTAVLNELQQPSTPEAIKSWFAVQHSWLEIVSPVKTSAVTFLNLDEGEAEAIALALEVRADLLLMDERDGTLAARNHGLTVTGTLGVLDQAAVLGLVDLRIMFGKLRQTTFRSPVRLMATLLEQDAIRKNSSR
jgi:predicted nucleic acid-binding protein